MGAKGSEARGFRLRVVRHSSNNGFAGGLEGAGFEHAGSE
jgi:hypothetical protein